MKFNSDREWLARMAEAENQQDITIPGSCWMEYDAAASELARKGLKGAIGDPLPNLMSAETVALINADPEAFERRVRAFAYAQAMEQVAEREAQAYEDATEPRDVRCVW